MAALIELPPGKSTWLYFLLVYLLARGDDILFYIPGRFLLFRGDQVHKSSHITVVPKSTASTPGSQTWCLIDPDGPLETPPRVLFEGGRLFPIQACSPNREKIQGWFKQRRPIVYGMPLWNRQDLLAGYARHHTDLRYV